MRILSIVGARPQFVKAAAMCRALAGHTDISHGIVHTGQHYDARMSDVFFEELGIPPPDHHLGVGSGTHAVQTGEMMKRLEPVIETAAPDWVLLYGDTNSTLAGALVAAKLHVRTAHVEAGLRSFNMRMPEEINRIVADRLSALLFCPTPAAIDNLKQEGLDRQSVFTGDIMYDAFLIFRGVAETRGGELASKWKTGEFALATIHRAENTDEPGRLHAILDALEEIAQTVCPVVLPLHPRTQNVLRGSGWQPRALAVTPPISYFEMLLLEGRARLILTDSGGVQKEAYFAKAPCVTLRDETEWVETLDNRCNVLTGAHRDRIVHAAKAAQHAGPWTAVYGDGNAGDKMIEALRKHPQ
jgi:UDP-GlcNAc3NAcA epimerase